MIFCQLVCLAPLGAAEIHQINSIQIFKKDNQGAINKREKNLYSLQPGHFHKSNYLAIEKSQRYNPNWMC